MFGLCGHGLPSMVTRLCLRGSGRNPTVKLCCTGRGARPILEAGRRGPRYLVAVGGARGNLVALKRLGPLRPPRAVEEMMPHGQRPVGSGLGPRAVA